MQGTVEFHQCTFSIVVAYCLDLAEIEQAIGLAQDQYYVLQEVALLQVVGLEVAFVGYQDFGQAIMEAPSIGYFATNFLVVVAIDSMDQATSCFVDQVIGYFSGQATDCFAGFAKEVGSTKKDYDNFSFAIDYCKDLKIVEDLEAYLFFKAHS